MSIVTVAQFKAYARKPDGDVTVEALYQSFIDAAEAEVAACLGYSPASATYTNQAYYGDGKSYLQLKAQPITVLSTVVVNGVSKTVADFDYSDKEWIKEKYGNPFPVGALITVTYTAGYASIPAPITLAILEITSLLAAEAGENIAVSSTSFDGGNTRSFVNYTNFDKFLAKLEQYRIRSLRRTAV